MMTDIRDVTRRLAVKNATAEKDEQIEWLNGLLNMSPSEVCKTTNVQQCRFCDDISCGDNRSQARQNFDKLKSKYAQVCEERDAARTEANRHKRRLENMLGNIAGLDMHEDGPDRFLKKLLGGGMIVCTDQLSLEAVNTAEENGRILVDDDGIGYAYIGQLKISDQVATMDDELDYTLAGLEYENRQLHTKLAHLEQKIAHGCIDAHCPECDGDKSPK